MLITAAGPATNVALGIMGLFVLLPLEGTHLSDLVGGGVLLWTVINFAFGITNLAPFTHRTAFGEVKSDGAQIWALRRIPDQDIEKILRQRNIVRASIEFAYGDMERCLSILEEDGESGEASILNNLAFTLFLRGNAGDLDEADELSAKAMEVLPMILSVRSTRGSVLIAQGRFREGVELLTDKRLRLDTPSNRATAYAIRAKGLAGLGKLALARESLRVARSLEPSNRHLSSAAAAIRSLDPT